MKANYKKVQKQLKVVRHNLLFHNSEIGRKVVKSGKRISEERRDTYLGVNFQLFDLIKQIENLEHEIERRIFK